MLNKKLVLGGLILVAAGCSTSPKAKNDSPPKATAVTAPATTEAKVTSTNASNPANPAEMEKQMVCKIQENSRFMEIEKVEPKGCDLYYTSYGRRDKVAWSVKGQNHCESVREKIKGNLEAAGYQCYEAEKVGDKETPKPSVAAVAPAAKPDADVKKDFPKATAAAVTAGPAAANGVVPAKAEVKPAGPATNTKVNSEPPQVKATGAESSSKSLSSPAKDEKKK